MRTADDKHELPVRTYEYFADRDALTRAVMDRILAGVSTRRFARVGEPVGGEVEQSSSTTSKTSVSEMFVERTATALEELMSRRLDDVRLAVMMLDGLEIAERTHRRARDHHERRTSVRDRTGRAMVARVLERVRADAAADPTLVADEALLFLEKRPPRRRPLGHAR